MHRDIIAKLIPEGRKVDVAINTTKGGEFNPFNLPFSLNHSPCRYLDPFS